MFKGTLLTGAVVLLGMIPGCLSPTLPLPPPSPPDFVSPPDSQGLATLRGSVPPRTTVLAQNLANGRLVGQATGDTGAYELIILAETDDQIALWYRNVNEDSGSIVVTIPGSNGVGGAAGGTSE